MPSALKMNDERLGCVIFRHFFWSADEIQTDSDAVGKGQSLRGFRGFVVKSRLKEFKKPLRQKYACSMSATERQLPRSDRTAAVEYNRHVVHERTDRIRRCRALRLRRG